MEYLKLILGLAVLGSFSWILIRNSKRVGILHSLLRIDTIVGVMAGLYLICTSALALML